MATKKPMTTVEMTIHLSRHPRPPPSFGVAGPLCLVHQRALGFTFPNLLIDMLWGPTKVPSPRRRPGWAEIFPELRRICPSSAQPVLCRLDW